MTFPQFCRLHKKSQQQDVPLMLLASRLLVELLTYKSTFSLPQQTFGYHSPYWNNTVAYNEGDGTSLAEVETKLSSYWSTPFTRLCLGMKYQQEESNWIALSHSGVSVWDAISNGTYTPTNISVSEWKSLLNNSQLGVST